MKLFKKSIAELFGTFCLVLCACGVASITSTGGSLYLSDSAHLIGTAMAFGLVLLVMCYSVGSVSGCHINPAVSLGFLLKNLFLPKERRDFGWKEFFVYVLAQLVGAFLGCLALWGLLGPDCGFGADAIQPLITTGPNAAYGYMIAAFVEIALTTIFVFVVLGVTAKKKFSKVSGLAIGFALMLVHIVGIPLTGTSVNPARGLWPSLFAAFLPQILTGTAPAGQAVLLNEIWIWTAVPFIGAAIAALLHWVLFMANEKNDGQDLAEDYVLYQTTNNNYYTTTTTAAPAKEEKVEEKPVEEKKEEEKPVEKVVEKKETVIIAAAPVEEEPEEEEVIADDGTKRRIVPFKTRLRRADPDLRAKYNELKEYCLSYDLHGRMSVDYDTYRLHKIRYVVFAIRGKAMKLHFNINPKVYDNSTITVLNDSKKNKYIDVPCVFKVKSDLSVKRAKKIIDDTMERAGIKKIEDIKAEKAAEKEAKKAENGNQ